MLKKTLGSSFGKTNIECVITTHKAAGKIIGEKEKITRDLGKDPILLETIENWKNGKITQQFTCTGRAVTEAKMYLIKRKLLKLTQVGQEKVYARRRN